MKKILFVLAVTMPIAAMGNGVVVTVNKNEMTGELTQAYITNSTNESAYRFEVTCEPSYGLSFNFCRKKYKYLPDVSCNPSFDYKFDNGEVKKYKFYLGSDSNIRRENSKSFLREVLEHKKIVTAPYPELPSMPTPVYNIADFKYKIKQFGEHCQLEPATEPKKDVVKPATTVKTSEDSSVKRSIMHTHGDRSHSHPLPEQGKAHRHGNGAVGK